MATLYAVDQATQERRSLDTLLVRVLDSTASGWGVQAGAILLSEGDSADVRVHQGMGGDLAAPAFGQALRMAERARTTGQPIFFQERLATDGLASTALLLLQTEGTTLGAASWAAANPASSSPRRSS